MVLGGSPTAGSRAQMELAVMQGTVTDEAGQPLDGVTIRIRDPERGRDIVVKSDKDGRFYRRGLQAVEYEMVVEKEGYQPINDKVRLTAGTDRRFDFKLAKAAPAGAGSSPTAWRRSTRATSPRRRKRSRRPWRRRRTCPSLRGQPGARLFAAVAAAPRPSPARTGGGARPRRDDRDLQFQLGRAYVDMKDLDKAMAAFEPGSGEATGPEGSARLRGGGHARRGVLRAKARRQGRRAFEKALAAAPRQPRPTLGLAKVHVSKGEVDKALALFDRVVAAPPGTPEADAGRGVHQGTSQGHVQGD